MEHVFTDIYESKTWGDDRRIEYSGSSGGGSTIEYNQDTYVPFVRRFVVENNIKTIADLGCGDGKCTSLLYDDLDVTYTGYDAYNRIVDYNSTQHPPPKYRFVHSDFAANKESIGPADMCILKDVLQHWPLATIYEFLDFVVEARLFTFVLICNCGYQTQDDTNIPSGGFRPLSYAHLPLRKYHPQVLYRYGTKEVSVIHTKPLV